MTKKKKKPAAKASAAAQWAVAAAEWGAEWGEEWGAEWGGPAAAMAAMQFAKGGKFPWGKGGGKGFEFPQRAFAGAGAKGYNGKGRSMRAAGDMSAPSTAEASHGVKAAATTADMDEDEAEEMKAVSAFLSRHNLLQYLEAFSESGFDTMVSVHLMTDADMRDECGMSPKHCQVLRKAISEEVVCLPDPVTSHGSGPAGRHIAGQGSALVTQPSHAGSDEGSASSAAASAPASASDQPLAGKSSVPVDLRSLRSSTGPNVKAPPAELRGYAEMAAFMQAYSSDIDEQTSYQSRAPPGGLLSAELGATPGAALYGAAMQGSSDGATTLIALAQLAEESAQYATAASAFVANPPDSHQVIDVANAAEQALQRANWASKVIASYEPAESEHMTEESESWVATIKAIIYRAAEVAQQAVENCRFNAKTQRRRLPFQPAPTSGEKRSRVPCRFFEGDNCPKGKDCPFSHDPLDKKPRLLSQKRPEECRFFATSQCSRGSACSFAHGAEELATIIALKEEQETKKRDRPERREIRRPGDWDCPECGDLQYARNTSCRRCGALKLLD